MKPEKIKYDFKAFGQAIKAARKAKGISRNELADRMNIAPRYIASIENSGQHPSLQIFYELVTLLDVSVDQFFFPNKSMDKSTQRRQLEAGGKEAVRYGCSDKKYLNLSKDKGYSQRIYQGKG